MASGNAAYVKVSQSAGNGRFIDGLQPWYYWNWLRFV